MTGLNSNINEVIESFRNKALALKQVDVTEALLVGVNAGMGQMKYRIFNEGKDVSNTAFGPYHGRKIKPGTEKLFKGKKKDFLVGNLSTFSEYELKRIKAGRQIQFKDLEFTGTLRRAIIVVKESNIRVVCVIPSNKQFNIANWQEDQVGKLRGGGRAIIFKLNDQERELFHNNTVAALNQLYARVINS